MNLEGTRDAQSTSNVRDMYVSALRELRRDAGCTPERLLKYPELYAALERRVQRAGVEATTEACVTELGELIKRLGDPFLREGLLAAMRLDPKFQAMGVTRRRSSFQAYLKSHPDPAVRAMHIHSLRQFERRENEAIEGVANHLAAYELSAQYSNTAYEPLSQDEDSEEIEVNLFPRVHANSSTYRFTPSGAMQRHDVVKQLYAPNHGTVRTSSWVIEYFADRQRGALQVESAFGWRLSESLELEDGTRDVTFELPRVLTPQDGLYSVGYRVIVNSAARCSPVVFWTPRSGAKRVDFKLIFTPEMKPARAWWFISRSRAEGLREPDETLGQHLEIFDCTEHIYIQKHFEPTGGLLTRKLHGIAWQWPDD
ncbi:hypothetical protein FKR81_37670 [Lentzea tibetensis]|uniref:Uncharacterized protein n=1 Tax=Lentzea tibetensis TaxID=2591470 RepID=A0A563EH56_9PSEU|nr:hypothetical protein [Lentzea tibetensis]TWP45953.1 hypothetical protein FKR81_37670 [Lentzea tibetensis]